MKALFLCDLTGNMAKPWLEAGFDCWCVDLQHPAGLTRDGHLIRVGADVHAWLPPRGDYAFCAAFPPCTDLASSGARWFKEKGIGGLGAAIATVERCRDICEWTGAPWMLENPIGTLSTYWRKPDHTFDPCDFGGYLDPMGDAYTKRTCLWTGGGFVMPDAKRAEPVEGSKMHLMSPTADRANKRSETPMGFAIAVFQANAKVLSSTGGGG